MIMDRSQNRRTFIKTTSGLLGAGMLAFNEPLKKQKLQLSFTTLGCPDWPYEKAVKFARENGYQGIEIRGILRELNLPKCTDFNTPEKVKLSRKIAEDSGVKIVCLGASAPMHLPEGEKRIQSLDEARQFIDLAEALGCPYVRVFPNNLPKDQEKKATLDLIKKGLITLAEYAQKTSVSVLMETHGDLVYADDILDIMQGVNHAKVGLVWDMTNMWSVTKEVPIMVYPKLSPYIKHVHVKDFKMQDGKMRYTHVGQGLAPVFQGLDLLSKGGYKGFYSFEWEKLWHHELEEPEEMFPFYVRLMRGFEAR